MIRRLMIANRGEIAVRIARTAHRLGIDTVGVFSEADRTALHTRTVDRAVALGGTSAAESYLRGDAVIEAALSTGCDAVHPGYGFLAEDPSFARDVESAGLIWVGPTPEQIELLGDKVAAKVEAIEAGVPTTEATVVTADDLPDGLPVPAMVKAAAGGGGRGMRTVHDSADMAEVVASASREAEAAFGDGTVFVEPLIEHGRHIEVQVLGDTHGNVVHLGERDCSIQRRHQKVVEEAPSPGIGEAVRTKLCEGAVALARRVGYRGAGTVEFLVSSDATIAFLEVNTRLQVEHPVTEAVWGVDLVELQLLVADGRPLPFTQGDLAPSGHAIEVRLVAEDPAAGWLPSTGTLGDFAIDGLAVRVDSGVAAGSVVSADYDSLLAKVIAWAPERDRAAGALARALRTAELSGVRTNADALAAILTEESFGSGEATTAYLSEHPEVAEATGPSGEDRTVHLVAAAMAQQAADREADSLWSFAPSGWRNVATVGQRRAFSDLVAGEGAEPIQLEYSLESASNPESVRGHVLVGAPPEPDGDGVLGQDARRSFMLAAHLVAPDRWQVELDGVAAEVRVRRNDEGTLTVAGAAGRTVWQPVSPFADHDAAGAAGGPVSPLPGSVISVHVSEGDSVSDGDLLVVVEAMKMEHRITARSDAVVGEVLVAEGDKVDAGDLLVTLVEPS